MSTIEAPTDSRHKRLFDADVVEQVREAVETRLDSNYGDTLYIGAKRLHRNHDIDRRESAIAIALMALDDAESGLSCKPSNPDAQGSRWTISREDSR